MFLVFNVCAVTGKNTTNTWLYALPAISSASLRFVISDIAQQNCSDKINEIKMLLKFSFLGKVRKEGYVRYLTCMQYCRLQRKTKKRWGHVMILIFLAEYDYLFSWSESCCSVYTQSIKTKQKKNNKETKPHKQPSVMKFMI